MFETKVAIRLLLACGLAAGCAGSKETTSNLPRSAEASLVEATSPCEWMVLASGVGVGSEKKWDNFANQDARKAAVSFVLIGGTDPLLQTPTERQRFESIKESFFSNRNYERYISWEEMKYSDRVRFENPRQLRITKHFKVNRCLLKDYLQSVAVLEETDMIQLGMPFIAVLPQVEKGHDPIDRLSSDPNCNHAAATIESHLTALRFETVVPRQLQTIDDLIHCEKYLSEVTTDNCYILANAIGSDIYIEFSTSTERNEVAGNAVRKVVSTVRAFETTTARLLGSETGYSEESTNSEKALIEQSLNDAVTKVLTRIEAYWKSDLAQGLQYKVHFAVSPKVRSTRRDEIQFACHDMLKSRSRIIKELANSGQNFDYLIWVDPKLIAGTTDLYRALQQDFQAQFTDVSLRRVVVNRKLAIFEIEKI